MVEPSTSDLGENVWWPHKLYMETKENLGWNKKFNLKEIYKYPIQTPEEIQAFVVLQKC